MKTRTNMRHWVLVQRLVGCAAAAVLLTGCGTRNPSAEVKEFQYEKNGFTYRDSYVLACIEGKQFVVTKGAHGYSSLAGPVRDCELPPNAEAHLPTGTRESQQ